jgi:hypothetical protein
VYRYCVYGLSLASSQPLPGLREAVGPTGDPVYIDVGRRWPEELEAASAAQWVHRAVDDGDAEAFEDGVLQLADRSFWRLRYTVADRPIEFAGDDRGRHIWVRSPPGAPFDDVASLLLGSVLARVLRLRGVFCLHAGVAAIGGPAVRAVSPADALPVLVAHSLGRVIISQEMRAQEFAFLGRLLRQVPVRELARPDDIGALGTLCRVIEDDFGRLF